MNSNCNVTRSDWEPHDHHTIHTLCVYSGQEYDHRLCGYNGEDGSQASANCYID